MVGLRAVIAHCWTGTPGSGWYPALASRLAALGYAVHTPLLPDTDDPRPEAWHSALTRAIGRPDAGLLLLGHSLGALAATRWLAAADARAGALVLVAPPAGPTGLDVVARFALEDAVIARALQQAARTDVLVGEADPYLQPSPQSVARRFTRHGANWRLLAGQGHFSPTSGATPLAALDPIALDFAQARRHGAEARSPAGR